MDDAGSVLYGHVAPCDSFQTGAMRAGEAKIFVLSDTPADREERRFNVTFCIIPPYSMQALRFFGSLEQCTEDGRSHTVC